ncbi:hypothetical protein ACTFIR_003872, partial [Dictyostelium discoideum]
NNN